MPAFLDRTGIRYNHLTVLKLDDKKAKNGKIHWICQCKCGNIISILSSRLNKKLGNYCPKCVNKDLINQRFGKLVVKEKIGSNKFKNIVWRCVCDCGNEHFTTTSLLHTNKNNGCKKCYNIKPSPKRYNYIPGFYFGNIKQSAKRRCLEFNITIKYIDELLIDQNFRCALSGLEIYLPKNTHDFVNRKYNASLDRIDSNHGYIIGNVQWVHKEINMMKQQLSDQRFIKLCNEVCSWNKKKEF